MERNPDTCCGKTSPGHSQARKAKTSGRSLKKPSKSQTQRLVSLDLRREDGHTPDTSWEMDTAWPIEFTMLNFGESRKDAEGCVWLPILAAVPQDAYCLNCGEKPNILKATKLRDVLEPAADPKYTLTEAACLGILRRMEKRGKELPKMMKEVLERQSQS